MKILRTFSILGSFIAGAVVALGLVIFVYVKFYLLVPEKERAFRYLKVISQEQQQEVLSRYYSEAGSCMVTNYYMPLKDKGPIFVDIRFIRDVPAGVDVNSIGKRVLNNARVSFPSKSIDVFMYGPGQTKPSTAMAWSYDADKDLVFGPQQPASKPE